MSINERQGDFTHVSLAMDCVRSDEERQGFIMITYCMYVSNTSDCQRTKDLGSTDAQRRQSMLFLYA